MKKMLRVYGLGLCAMIWGVLAQGGDSTFEAGRLAFESGEYQGAYSQWQPLAQAGDARAQDALGQMYLNGVGVRRNYFTAFDLFYRAASAGSAEAQYHIALMYLEGRGVSRNHLQAMKWFKRSATQGNADAKQYVNELMRQGLGMRRIPYAKSSPWSKYG